MTPGKGVKIRTRYFPNTNVPVWYQTIRLPVTQRFSGLHMLVLPTILDKPATILSTLRTADNSWHQGARNRLYVGGPVTRGHGCCPLPSADNVTTFILALLPHVLN